ncbi:anti-lipopolysaccharide factor-like [Scylla paramamosain]|uniref:anti-lipopolysaccharide factor-like n=1 Tax=Scylla paramamosain TaxID=85552 RepID=UPI0030826F29
MYHGKPVNESVAILATSQRQPLKNRQRLQCHSPGLGSSKRKLLPEPAISMARVSLLLIVLSIALVTPSQGFVKELLFRKVKDTLLEDGTTEILDHVCNYRVTPLLQNSELYFKGDVWCPSWTVIKGESLTRSRTRVVNRAIADFARKALAEGLVTQEDAQLFLE